VWDENMLKDYLIGTLTLPMSKANEYTGGNIIRRYDLVKKNGDGKEENRGFIWVKVKHTTNLMEV
ncbi:unnamed protein product, partial [Candidula unifasciata]